MPSTVPPSPPYGPAIVAVVALLVFALSWALTRAVRRYARARLLDVPNARSSHTAPTPRGGGLAIVAALLPGLAALGVAGIVPARLLAAAVPGAALVAAIGWLDDRRGVPARYRALVHLVAALWSLAWLDGLPVLRLGGADARLGPAGWVVGALGIVWVTNLYNFMDGIDGIAAGQAVSVGLGGAVLLWFAGAPGLAAPPLLLAAASAGFLLWNWQPARIFMGDVGSATLGYLFAVIAVASENAGALPVAAWVVLMAAFVVDATFTLARRALRGERVYEAHCSHAYQRAVQAGLSHARVSGAVIALNALLVGLALTAALNRALAVPALLTGIGVATLLYWGVERLRPMR